MKPTIFSFVAFAFCLFYQAGCSLIGLALGATAEPPDEFSAGEQLMIEYGDSVMIVLKDGSRIGGTLLQSRSLPPQTYRTQYDTYLQGSGDRLFQLADTVTVLFVRGKNPEHKIVGPFAGFDVGGKIKIDHGTHVKWYPLENVESVSNLSGSELGGSDLYDRLITGEVPLDRGLLLRVDGKDTLFQMYELDSLYADTGNNAMLIGFLAGAAVDVLIVVSLANYDCGSMPD